MRELMERPAKAPIYVLRFASSKQNLGGGSSSPEGTFTWN